MSQKHKGKPNQNHVLFFKNNFHATKEEGTIK